jgi:hypothetical protein
VFPQRLSAYGVATFRQTEADLEEEIASLIDRGEPKTGAP